jgi:hypothetical protein
MTAPETVPIPVVPSPRPAGRRALAGLVVRAVQVRLRFIAVLAIALLVVGQWDALRNRWAQLGRALRGESTALAPVSNDTEYFCPMDPGVVSDWPGKCGVCNMTLVRRRKGDATPLPSGVVARMQVSPYRLQLAGVRTSPVGYQALSREARLEGTVVAGAGGSSWDITIDDSGHDSTSIARGQAVELDVIENSGRTILAGRVASEVERMSDVGARLTVHLDDPARTLRAGAVVTLRVRRPIAEIEPFRSLPSGPPPGGPGQPREFHTCPDHAEVVALTPGRCPVDGKSALESVALRADQRLGWWCPMHPKVQADRPGQSCRECGGMALVPRVVTYRPEGQVLSVPDSAVVDTGTRSVVFVERMPGMFDGVEVTLGPRCGDFFPVLRGLESGQRVATAGAFLLDAETRLNPALASAYFGAARSDRAVEPRPGAAESPAALPPELRALADAQQVCPVTGKPLGSMGTPVKVSVAGRTVLVCCEGCVEPLTKAPGKYLARLPGRAAARP